uniref:Bestrophin homolog n=1 Tax=Chlamydomonas euryale TaxID=1486919 RepID=A0A7R9YYD9_9CHLO|mmetsp:Transcript_33137/g.98600  ORF Transcript_33137/g.98600 Transcript_33137/m.98600 type:complete len:177 (+) Transcript_33137:876-1406(+)
MNTTVTAAKVFFAGAIPLLSPPLLATCHENLLLRSVQAITNIIATAGLKRPETVMSMDDNCSLLVRSISACERLLNTPIPMSYTRHTARILMLWLMYMPFSLWGYCGWAMVPITALVSFVLLGIEEIGVYIEEPFSLLPLEALCAKLEFGLTNMMADHLLIARHSTETEAMRAIQL